MATRQTKFLLLVLVSLITQKITAKNSWEHKIGINYSYFHESGNKVKPGLVYGLERGWQLNEILLIHSGASLSVHRGIFQNKTRGWEDPFGFVIFHCDITYHLAMLNLPVMLNLRYNFTDVLRLYFEIGPNLNLSVYNLAQENVIRKQTLPKEEWKDSNFDTWIDYERKSTIIENSGFSVLIGIGMTFHRFDLRFLYSYPFNRIYNVGNFVINENMDVFGILLGYRIK